MYILHNEGDMLFTITASWTTIGKATTNPTLLLLLWDPSSMTIIFTTRESPPFMSYRAMFIILPAASEVLRRVQLPKVI